MTLKQWNEIKVWLAPVTALILWLISVICFVFGLSFKNPIVVANYDVTLYIAFAIAACNTFIQLIGNGNTEKDESGVFSWIWVASYLLGIASNTNALLQMLGISSIVLEWAVALSLGAIIEIAPEKLIMIWLKSVQFKVRFFRDERSNQNSGSQNKNQPTYRPVTYPPVQQHKGQGSERRKMLEAQQRKEKRPAQQSDMPAWLKGME